MIIEHLGKTPEIHPSAYVAPNATICGDVEIGMGARIMFGVSVIAEGGRIRLGANSVVLENAVIRSTPKHSTHIGTHTLIGPQTHIVGCGIEDSVFIGSNNTLIAPIALKKDSYVAAGSTITKDVETDDLAIGRARQENKKGYAKKIKQRKEKTAKSPCQQTASHTNRTKQNEKTMFMGAVKTPGKSQINQ